MKGTAVVMACLGMAAAVAAGGVFQLSRSTIDSGGLMRSYSGEYELSGTIGQPDTGILIGGDLELSAGFWFEYPPIDCNEDGITDLLDHDVFSECLAGPDGGVPSGCECFDVDRGGAVDLRDFAAAQNVFDGQP